MMDIYTFENANADQMNVIHCLIERAFDSYVKILRPDATSGPYPWLGPAIARGDIFVAKEESRNVGAICTSRKDKNLFIDQLAVDPQRQNAGIGSWLLENTQSYARLNGFTEMSLITAVMMEDLMRFYGRHGYRVTGNFLHTDGRDEHLRVILSKAV